MKICPSTRPGVSGKGEFERAVPLMRLVADNVPPKRAGVEVNLIGRRAMASLNRTYRDRKGATAILTFAYGDGRPGLGWENAIGEILLCWPPITAEAALRGVPPRAYLLRLLVHGLLHLRGHRHDGDASERAMEREEMRYLRGHLDEDVLAALFA